MRKVLIVVVAALLAVALVAGCGGSSSSSSTASTTPVAAVSAPSMSAQQVMLKASKATAGLTSASFTADVAVKMTGSGSSSNSQTQALTQSPINVHAEGSAAKGEGAKSAVDATVTLSAGGQNMAAGIKVSGGKTWVELQDVWYAVPASKTKSAQKAAGASPEKTLGDLGIDPKAWSENATVAVEQLDGTTVYHVTAKADSKQVMADLMKALNDPKLLKAAGSQGATLKQLKTQNEAQLKSLQDSLVSATAQYWVDADTFYVRKGSIDADLSFKGAVASQGLQSATLATTYTLGDFDQPVTVTPPASAKPFKDLMKGLFNYVPGASAGTGLSGL